MKALPPLHPLPPLDLTDLVGIRYAEADCWEIVLRALARCGVEIERPAATALWRIRELFERAPDGLAQLGDLITMRGNGDGLPHIAMAVDGFRMIHATREGGSRIDRICDWETTITGRFRRRVAP